jgi:hypothetical protein
MEATECYTPPPEHTKQATPAMMRSTSLVRIASPQRVAYLIACGALAGYYILSSPYEPSIASGRRPAHEYSIYDPEWTQVVFPRLGTRAAGATSPTGALTYLANRSSVLERLPLATIAQVSALALFGATLLRLGLPAAVTVFAVVSLGLHPAMMQGATTWTPYLLLPLLSAATLIVCLHYSQNRDRRYAILLAILAASVIAESLYAALLLSPLLAWRDGPVRDRAIRRRDRIVGVAGVLAAGLALQIIGAALAWHDLATPFADAPTWRDAFVAVTTRWGRLVAIYAAPSIEHTRAVLGLTLTDLGPLAVVLALAGLVATIRTRSVHSRWVMPLLIASFTTAGCFVSPLSSVSPVEIPLAALILLLAAFGLAALAKRVPWTVVPVVLFGAVVATRAGAAARLNPMPSPALQEASFAAVVTELQRPAAIVASNVDIDRRIDVFFWRHPSASPILRIPDGSNAIRREIGRGAHVFAWEAFHKRIEALGFMLAPATIASKLPPSHWVPYEIIDTMPCAQLQHGEWSDVTAVAHAGAISLQPQGGGAYAVEFDAPGVLIDELDAHDAITSARTDLVQQARDRYRVEVKHGRRSLPVVSFDEPPAQLRARFAPLDSATVLRVCGVPSRGVVLRMAASGDFTAVELDNRAAFNDGWHNAESGPDGRFFRWSSARTALIHVQLPGRPATAQIQITAMPALPPNRSPVLSFRVNDRVLESRPMTPGVVTYTWTVPAEALRRGLNVFRLTVPDVISPLAIGVSDDARQMGLALAGFRMRLGG